MRLRSASHVWWVVRSGMVANYKQNSQTAQAIQRMYLRDYVDKWRKFVEGFSVTKYANAGDAARKLEILGDRKSPLLAVFVMTANATNFPAPARKPMGAWSKRSSTPSRELPRRPKPRLRRSSSRFPAAQDNLNSPADIPRYFQPVHVVEPPGSATWVVDKNAAYIEALVQLRSSMQDIAQKGQRPGGPPGGQSEL